MRRILEEHLQEVQSALQSYESIADVEVMLDELVRVRASITQRPQDLSDEEVLLFLLCVITYPGKPPTYTEPATRFRQSFIGIRFDHQKRDWFRGIVFNAVANAAAEGEPVDFGNVADVLGRAVTMSAPQVSAQLY